MYHSTEMHYILKGTENASSSGLFTLWAAHIRLSDVLVYSRAEIREVTHKYNVVF
jgi:hypothetical protein